VLRLGAADRDRRRWGRHGQASAAADQLRDALGQALDRPVSVTVKARRDPVNRRWRRRSELELGAEIPPQLYTAVAEALAWAYRLDANARSVRRPR
jgi:hypothetical protein